MDTSFVVVSCTKREIKRRVNPSIHSTSIWNRNLGDLSWSPDGKGIILTAELKSINDDDIWIASTSDSTVRDLSNSPEYYETNPA
jgi:Tol biopolymer transport system component